MRGAPAVGDAHATAVGVLGGVAAAVAATNAAGQATQDTQQHAPAQHDAHVSSRRGASS